MAVTIGELTEPEPVTLIGEFLDHAAKTKRDALRPMVRYIFEAHVTHLPTEMASEFEVSVLDQMTAAFASDLKDAQRLSFTPEGVRASRQNPVS